MEPINKKFGMREIKITENKNTLDFNLFQNGELKLNFSLKPNGDLISPIKPLNIHHLRVQAINSDLNQNHKFIDELIDMPSWDIKKIAFKMGEHWKMSELQKRFKENLGAGSNILKDGEQSKKSMEK